VIGKMIFMALCFGMVLGSGWFLWRISRRFVEEKPSLWAKALLFVTMACSSGMVIWIGDNNFAMTFPIYLGAFLLATKGDWLGRLTVGCIFFCFIMSVCAMSNTYLIRLSEGWMYDLFSRIVRPILFGICYLILYRQLQKPPVQLPHRLWKLCAGLTLLPMVTLSVLILPAYWMPSSDLVENLILLQGVFILPLSLISSIALLRSILVLEDYELKAQAAALADMREVYYQGLQKEQTQVRTLRHDLRNHLGAALGLLERNEQEKARRYLEELAESPVLRRSRRLCDNELVNVVLTSKCEEMERCGIGSDIRISLPEQLPFADTDLCALFGNALDNAIEAANRAQGGTITLRCQVEYGMFMLFIRNPLAGDERDDLQTTKQDKRLHGFGLVGMREIAARYGGVLDAGRKGNSFELTLNLPLSLPEKRKI
jgi:two-component system sensor histidine kinase AgrC